MASRHQSGHRGHQGSIHHHTNAYMEQHRQEERSRSFRPAIGTDRHHEKEHDMARGPAGDSPINVTHHLKGIHFPAKKPDLIQHAKQNGAPSEVMQAIEAMPDQNYETMADVMKGFKQAE
jgi:uncharacterized protein DUF2795